VSFSAGLTADASIAANSSVAFQRVFINTGGSCFGFSCSVDWLDGVWVDLSVDG